METLAVELQERIFLFACTDGGYTGCSLSLVSKNIREASRAARFHSVSLMESSICQLSEFVACFRTEGKRALTLQGISPRVRHLCISGCTNTQTRFRPKSEEQAPRRVGPGGGMSSAPCWMSLGIGRMDVGADQQQAFDDAVSEIIAAVSQDLYTLSVCHGWATYAKHFRMPTVDGAVFPVLEELTLSGMEWNFRTNHGMFGAPTTPLPNLMRLHISDVGATGRYVDLSLWSARAPRLTHFRLTNMGPWSDVFAQVKAALVPESESVELVFPSLQQLILQPNTVGGCSLEAYAKTCYDLALVANRPLVVLPLKDHVGQPDERAETKGRWLDRIVGGPGCWETHLQSVGGAA